MLRKLFFSLMTVALLAPALPASAADDGKIITFATFDVGTSNYVELSVVGEAIAKKFGPKFRLIPQGNTVARVIALSSGRTMFWQTCSGHYSSFEGLDDFGTERFGPQPIQMLWVSNRKASYSPAATAKSGIKTMAEVKGKRVAWVVGAPSINMQMEAYLAFAGLTWDDVKKVEFPGYPANTRGQIAGTVDVVMNASAAPVTHELAASPQGMVWLPVPASDTEGWKRAQAICSFIAPQTITEGAGVKKGESIEVGSYPCPIILALKTQDENLVYNLTKMIAETGPDYLKTMSQGDDWQLDKMLKSRFVVPFHKGSVKYFKEIGKWTDAHEARQQELLKRQQVLADAFADTKKRMGGKKAEEFAAAWEKDRLAALQKAGLSLY